MISPESFFRRLSDSGVDFFTGVPDSLLKEFCAYVDATLDASRHLIAANEGTAVGVATGYHLATGKVPVVYMQNSGLGNSVNPVLSLADPEVYGVPMILLIGWRGEPGVKDEPQHIKQGRVTPGMLDAMEIPYRVLTSDEGSAFEAAEWAVNEASKRSGPVALLAREGVFSKSGVRVGSEAAPYSLSRERAVECVTDELPSDVAIVSTTGKLSRELYELRARKRTDAADFLTVGSMGHASQIALGLAIASPHKRVVCLDGDGAAIMHMGGLATIGAVKPKRFIHVILNNGAHESVGGQPTVGFQIALDQIARAAGYAYVSKPAENEEQTRLAMRDLLSRDGPSLLEVRIGPGSRADLGRPKESPRENKKSFVERFRGTRG